MQRGEHKFSYISDKFEFPRGKIELGESRENALSRELKEELHLEIVVDSDDYMMTVEHDYKDI